MTQKEFIEACIGKPVTITFLDGKQVKGTLMAHDTYTLLVQQQQEKGQVEVLVFKHAIKYVLAG